MNDSNQPSNEIHLIREEIQRTFDDLIKDHPEMRFSVLFSVPVDGGKNARAQFLSNQPPGDALLVMNAILVKAKQTHAQLNRPNPPEAA